MRDCKSKFAKYFAHRQLRNRVHAVHVLHDLDLRMDSLASDRPSEQNIDDTHIMLFVAKKVFDLEIFESLEVDDDSAVNTNSNYTETHILEMLDSSSATHHIASYMSPPQESW